MAFPWLTHETFDDGTRGNYDAETDASALIDFPDYRELARGGFAPWQGGHALRVRLSDTATADITETGAFDTSADGTIHVWFPLLVGADLSLPASDTVVLFSLDSAGPLAEVVMGVRNNAGTYELFAGETGATRTLPITPNNKQWHQIELSANIDSGVPNDGTLDFYVDGAQVGAQITGLGQGAITQSRLGPISGPTSGATGTILIGGIIADDARVYPRTRFPTDTFWVTRDIAAWVGPCLIDSASITGTSTDAVMTILDTDIFSSTGIDFSREPVVYLRNVTTNDQAPGFNTPVQIKRGAYIQLTGTNPQGWVSIKAPSAVVKSSAQYVDRGLRR